MARFRIQFNLSFLSLSLLAVWERLYHNEMRKIYLDYNATTPLHQEVVECMRPFLDRYFGNPSSSHWSGIETKKAVEKARSQVASTLGCDPEEVLFTSGGTESNNLALKGYAYAHREDGNHIIVSAIEHPSVMEVARYLEKNGFQVTYLPVDRDGIIMLEELKRSIIPRTILISVMHANNEVGTIQPISAIVEIARKHEIAVHTDAAQTLGKIGVNVKKLGVDLLSIAGHKLYGPKGVGALFIKRGTIIEKLIHGAGHEMNLRAGTENVLEIVGLGKACEIAGRDLGMVQSHLKEMRDRLEKQLVQGIPSIRINGHTDKRLPNTTNVGFPGIEANTMLSEIHEIAASAGAACHSDRDETSSILTAMGVPMEYRMGSIRFSTGRDTGESDIDQTAKEFIRIFRKIKPVSGEDSKNHIQHHEVRLTQYTHGLGCACKLRPQDLEKILKNLPSPSDPNVLIGHQTSDDAAVYKLDEQTAIVNTVDFFTPVVDDPFHFGRIAAANALSDIYAMGATPIFALNIVAFPVNRLPLTVLEQILEGAGSTASEAGIAILGGHSIEDMEPKFGLAVTGIVHPKKFISNSGGQPGDLIILTKPLGTGILSTAMKRNMIDKRTETYAIEIMAALNNRAASIMKEYPVSCCTDVTGFGLIGHLSEMTSASQVNAELYANRVPLLPKVRELATANVIPGGTLNNMEHYASSTSWDSKLTHIDKVILSDAQTSGGLIISIPEKDSGNLLHDLHQSGINEAAIIGKLVKKGTGKIQVMHA